MENKIKIFESEEFGRIRTLKEESGKVVFCGSDIAKALGYRNVSDALVRHCKGIVKHDIPHPQSPTKTIEMTFIPEGDVYRLVAHSRLPGAAKFESWIFDEVSGVQEVTSQMRICSSRTISPFLTSRIKVFSVCR